MFAGAAFADYGTTSMPVLMMENYSAQAVAMAGTGVAIRGTADSVFANPAGLVGMKRMCLSATMIGWMFDTTYYAFSFGMPIPGSGRAGWLSVNGEMFTLGDFETVVDGVSSGAATSGDFEAGITYANNIFKPFNDELGDKVHLDLGLTVSYAQAKMADFTASELTFDTGMLTEKLAFQADYTMAMLGDLGASSVFSISALF